MRPNLIVSLLIASLVAVVASKITYFGFTPNYESEMFSVNDFKFRFAFDVYKYRIFGKYLLYSMDSVLKNRVADKPAEPRLEAQVRGASERFYYAYYYLNTIFLILTNIMIVLLGRLKGAYNWTLTEQNLLLFLIPAVVALSEFTVGMYDVSSYFFELLILYLFLKYYPVERWLSIATIGALIALSTTNIESSGLFVAILAVLLLARYGISKRVIIDISILAFCFVAPYLALRYAIQDPFHLSITNKDAGKILKGINLYGLLFWGLFLYLPIAISNSLENRLLIGLFLLFSAPYIFNCFKGGVLWEVRLFMPLFLGSLFLSKLDVSKNVLRLSGLLPKRIFILDR